MRAPETSSKRGFEQTDGHLLTQHPSHGAIDKAFGTAPLLHLAFERLRVHARVRQLDVDPRA